MNLTKELLNKYFSYNPEEGIFTRKTSYNSFRKGDISGSVDSQGYIIISIKGERIKAHRAAMIMTHGKSPDIVDHINGVKSDNRINNLRAVSSRQSSRNTSKSKRNSSGRVGVYWNKRGSKWQARICGNNGQRIQIGYFKCKLEAVAARIRAEKDLGYHENHGRNSRSKGRHY